MTSTHRDLEVIICGSQIVCAVPKMVLYFLSMMLLEMLYSYFIF